MSPLDKTFPDRKLTPSIQLKVNGMPCLASQSRKFPRTRANASNAWVAGQFLGSLLVVGIVLSGSWALAQDEPPAADISALQRESEAKQQGLLLVGEVFRARAAEIEQSMVVIESFGGATAASGRIGGLRAQGEGNTTGLIVDESGWIATSSFNFVGQPPVVTVVTPDGERYVARLMAQDFTRNLCLLKIQGVTGLKVPEFADPSEVRLGQWVAALGTGYGDRIPAVSVGIVSATGRASGRAVQTDASTSPANYGGPLIDLEGRVVGICVPLNPSSPGPAAGAEWYDSGIGFAIPIDLDANWWRQLKSGENIEFGFLGVAIGPADQAADVPGVKVNSVVDDGPAAKAGIAVEDRLVRIGGRDVLDPPQFGVELRRYHADETVELIVLRGEEELAITVELGRNPSNAPEIAPVQQPEVEPIEGPPENDNDR